MVTILRIISGLIGLAGLAQFLNYARFISPPHPDPLALIFVLVAGAVAFAGLWFAIRGGDPAVRRRMASSLMGGVIVGIAGFIAGFFGPMILAPDANQGPLLGIFITGPLGFVAGLVGGYLRARPR